MKSTTIYLIVLKINIVGTIIIKIQADLNNDTKLFQEYITSLNELSEGLKVTDSPKVQAATDKLLQLANQNPVFYNSEQFKTAIEKPTDEIKKQAEALEKQEELLSKAINNLKAQYLL
ncbi:MAG: hypothetical protein HC932_03160 [Thermales bacterium]|nr:hypothetical protein [Thermales bacterium]